MTYFAGRAALIPVLVRRRMQRRCAVVAALACICTRAQQRLYNGSATASSCNNERRGACAVCLVSMGASLQQRLHDACVALLGCREQGCGASTWLWDIHVCNIRPCGQQTQGNLWMVVPVAVCVCG